MIFFVHDIAKIINVEIIGDHSFEIHGFASFDEANFNDITFAWDPKYLNNLGNTRAKVVIVPNSFILDKSNCENKILLKTESPKTSFFKLVSIFNPAKELKHGVHSSAIIGHNVKIGNFTKIEANSVLGDNVTIDDNVRIMAGVFIGDETKIGSNTIIKPNVTIMERSKIGKHVLIHSGTVIGSDGFGFTQEAGTNEKIVHTGFVKIGDNVEIGACNTIDRGTLGMTIIGNGVKTDNLVHIAHNVKIGDDTLIVAQVGIAGSSIIGKNVIIAGKAAVTGHIKIGNGSIVGPFAGVHSDVGENKIVSGIPHMPHTLWRKVVSIIPRLPEIRKKIFSFEKRLKDLENKNKPTEKK